MASKVPVSKRCIGWSSPRFAAYFWFVGWDCLSLGAHVCLSAPNIEIHVPFGFFRFGVPSDWRVRVAINNAAEFKAFMAGKDGE